MQLPFKATTGQRELHFTYLDTFGRPVVVYHKNNVVEQHIQEFEVRKGICSRCYLVVTCNAILTYANVIETVLKQTTGHV